MNFLMGSTTSSKRKQELSKAGKNVCQRGVQDPVFGWMDESRTARLVLMTSRKKIAFSSRWELQACRARRPLIIHTVRTQLLLQLQALSQCYCAEHLVSESHTRWISCKTRVWECEHAAPQIQKVYLFKIGTTNMNERINANMQDYIQHLISIFSPFSRLLLTT